MAITREEHSNSKLEQLLPPVAISADKDDIVAVDVSGFESVLFSVLVGAAAVEPADDKHVQIRLKHSNDNVNFIDCSDEEVIGTVAGLNTGTIANIKTAPARETSFMAAYIGDKGYVKPVIKVTGELGDGVLIGISATLHNPKYKPAA